MNFASPKALSILIILAIIMSGSSFFLKRVGLVDHEKYSVLLEQQKFFKTKLNQFLQTPSLFSAEQLEQHKNDFIAHKQKIENFVYTVDKKIYAIKFFKILVSVFIVLLGLISMIKSRKLATDKTILILVLWVTIASVISLINFGWVPVISSVYFYLFLLVILLSQSLATNEILKTLSRYLFYSFILFLIVAILELFIGLSVFSAGPILEKRIVSFFNQPNTLGIFIVFSISLYISTNSNVFNNPFSYVCFACAFLLIILSGSNTAAFLLPLCFLNLNLKQDDQRSSSSKQKLLLILCILIAIIVLTERFASGSFFGRLDKYQFYFSEPIPILNYIFGQGIGISTNSILSIGNYFNFSQFESTSINLSVDSTPLSLIIQIGLLGCFIFYWMIIRAMLDDIELRLVYIVILISSLATNITEHFPINLILALMLAKSHNSKRLHSNEQLIKSA